MSNPRELVLVRHGQSTANAAGVWQGRLDFPLSEQGRDQARRTGKLLAGFPFEALYASPLSRAHETARIIGRESGFRGEVSTHPGLVERAGGLLEGTTREEREARDPDLVKKLESLPEEERWSVVGAETDEEVLDRFDGAISEVFERHPSAERVVVVSHGGSMRAFLKNLFGDVLSGAQRTPNASVTRVSWDADGGRRLVELASAEHLTRPTGSSGE